MLTFTSGAMLDQRLCPQGFWVDAYGALVGYDRLV
jgi:hypothetical protein